MLQRLTIKNYALINSLDIELDAGLNIITGETGAGKSIILGALALLLGQRIEAKYFYNAGKKCIVEGTFTGISAAFNNFIEEEGLDAAPECTIRREISAEGRSRAFINDTPVNLTLLKSVTGRLIDIHAQQATQQLNSKAFQLEVLDILANNAAVLEQYKTQYRQYTELGRKIAELEEQAAQALQQHDYEQFIFNELEAANLQPGEDEQLEEEIKLLQNAEQIKEALYYAESALDTAELNALAIIKDASAKMQGIESYSPAYAAQAERLRSAAIEIKDVAAELAALAEDVNHNPERLELATERLNMLYTLQQKHRTANIEELIALREKLETSLERMAMYDTDIEALKNERAAVLTHVEALAGQLHEARVRAAESARTEVEDLLQQVGIPNGRINYNITELPAPGPGGSDDVDLQFSANKGQQLQSIGAVASGGEQSRLMLALKSITARGQQLATIIFDEIDTGVSGEVAGKVGGVLQQLAANIQVVVITHLPQIAARGSHHYVVYKLDDDEVTQTNMRLLGPDERVTEIAEMLSGKNPPESAMQNARQLLNN